MCKGWCVRGCVVGGYCYRRVYGNRFCMMTFVRVIGGYVKMMRLCSSRTGYVGTVGIYYRDAFGMCGGLREYGYIV